MAAKRPTNIHASIRFSLATVQVLDDLREQAEAVHKDLERRFPDKSTRPKLKKGCARGLHFAPLNALKRRFVTVDASDLAPMLGLPAVGAADRPRRPSARCCCRMSRRSTARRWCTTRTMPDGQLFL